MKHVTTSEQSRMLADILPIESADAHYVRESTDFMGNPVDGKWSEAKLGNPEKANYIIQNFTSYEIIPAWSLGALLDVLPYPILGQAISKQWYVQTLVNPDRDITDYVTDVYDTPIEACIDAITELHKPKEGGEDEV